MHYGAYLLLAFCAAIGLLGALLRHRARSIPLAVGLILYGSFAGAAFLVTSLPPGVPSLLFNLWYAVGRIGLLWGVVLLLRPHLRSRLGSGLALSAAVYSIALPLIIIVATLKLPHPTAPLVPSFEGLVYLATGLAAWSIRRLDPRAWWVALTGLIFAIYRLEWLLPLSAEIHQTTGYLDHLALIALAPALWLRPRQDALARAA